VKFVPYSWAGYGEEHERGFREWVLQNVPRGGVFVDVGAMIGHWAVNLSTHFDKVYAIEASPQSVDVLRRNIAENGVTNVEVIQKAASSSSESIFLTGSTLDDPSRPGSIPNWGPSLTPKHPTNNTNKYEVVECLTIDSLELSPRLVKIDTEGWGGHILRGAIKTIPRTDFFMVEIHNLDEGKTCDELLKGFTLIPVRGAYYDDGGYQPSAGNRFYKRDA
jgi:FkbM family methyltransferase